MKKLLYVLSILLPTLMISGTVVAARHATLNTWQKTASSGKVKVSNRSGTPGHTGTAPTTTVPPAANSLRSLQDKGGLSVSTGSSAVQIAPPITQSPVTAPQSSNSDAITQIIKNITFYGYPDNDPPGTAIAYPVLHSTAGGSGTFLDPLTFATKSTFPKGTVLYVPFIQKYVIMEDQCASCSSSHIDIWMPSNGDFDSKVLACEDKWTKTNQQVILNPPPDLPVSPPLFDIITGTCS